MPVASAGVQSSIDVSSQPVISASSTMSQSSTWTWVWFIVAVLVVLGFHIRLFGHPVPPAANFP